jgi:hypothetical protein
MMASLLKAITRGKAKSTEEDWPREYMVDGGAAAPAGEAAGHQELEVSTPQRSMLGPHLCLCCCRRISFAGMEGRESGRWVRRRSSMLQHHDAGGFDGVCWFEDIEPAVMHLAPIYSHG